MKNTQIINKLVLTLLLVLTLGCVNDDEITIAPYPRIIFSENFDQAINNTNLDIVGWTNFSQAGTKVWRERTFSGNGYAEFSAFQSGETSNVGWLVTPKISAQGFDQYYFSFDTAKFFLDEDSELNSLTAYYSTNFNGTNVAAATWIKIEPINVPKKAAANYAFLSTKYQFPISGDIYFAFKYVGNGLLNSTLDGGFQIDNILVYGIK